jgi:hypothetical protein
LNYQAEAATEPDRAKRRSRDRDEENPGASAGAKLKKIIRPTNFWRRKNLPHGRLGAGRAPGALAQTGRPNPRHADLRAGPSGKQENYGKIN